MTQTRKDISIMSSPYTKINHTLPKEVYKAFEEIGDDIEKRNAYIAALRNGQWSLQSIADAVGFTRERIRQICEVTSVPTNISYSIPTPPLKPVKEKRVLPEPDQKSIERLLKLQPMAQQVRSHSTKFRKEAEEYSALVYKVYKEDGVSLFRLAKYLGVTHGALRFRMARYGYIKTKNPKSSCYQPILEKNRYVLKS
ncbi:MAG: hypothetical protein EBT95_00135 [Verrucomicrobia bacterium]|nr:hypothetical protein [Verrucomicrobiota bacterium]